MKTMVIIPAGQFGKAFRILLNEKNYELLCMADNSKKIQGTWIFGTPVCSVEEAVGKQPDTIDICTGSLQR